MSETPPPALGRAVFKGAILMVVLRFAMRGIGLVSLSVTARLLTPADFGVVGSAAIVTGLFTVLQSSGVFDELVRRPTLAPGDLDAAWTLNLAFNLAVALGIAAAAVPAAAFLNEPALAAVLPLLALIPLLGALASPVSVAYARAMEFGREFRLRVVQKLLQVGCVIGFCLVFRSYWGTVWGGVSAALLFCLYTHALAPHRPRLVWRGAGALLRFSAWSMAQSLAVYVAVVGDEVIVRRGTDAAEFGLYHVSRDLSRVLVSEFVAPAAQALLPGLAQLAADRARFAAAAARAVGVGAVVAAACGAGVSATAPEIVRLLLGAQWAPAAPYLTSLALGGAGQTLAGLHRSVLVALGRPDASALLWGVRALVQVAACSAAMTQGGAMAVAVTFMAISLLLTLADYAAIFAWLGRARAAPVLLLRPVLAGGLMLAALALLPWPAWPLPALAAAKVAAGAAIYAATLGLLWLAAGRPEGAEAELLRRAPAPVRRLLPGPRG